MAVMPHDALLGLLYPAWQAVIGVGVALMLAFAGWRLVRRGPSRMNRAVLVSGIAVLAIVALGILLDGHNRLELSLKHGLEYTRVELAFPDRAAAKAWIAA